MSWSIQSVLPVNNSTLKPAIPNNVKNENSLQKQKQKSYSDEIAKLLPPIEKGEIIRVWDKQTWNKAHVEDTARTPESYIITGESGRTYRHNQHHLLKSQDPEPLQMQCDIEPELDNTNLDNNTEPPENCATTITTSNTSKKTPITPWPPLLRRSNRMCKCPSYLDDYQQ